MVQKSLKPIKKGAPISSLNSRYCSCLQKVRSAQYKKYPADYKKTKKATKKDKVVTKNPIYSEYAVCTKSVYNTRGLQRSTVVNCSKNYDFESLPKYSLQAFALDKKMKLTDNNGRVLTKKQLLRKIKSKVAAEETLIKTSKSRKTMKK